MKLLQKDVKKRLTAEEALSHPWVREGSTEASDKKIDVEVLKRMKNFAGLQKFKKVGLMLLVRHLKKEEVEGLRQLFMDMDADRSGKVTIDELRQGLDRHGAKMAKAEVEALMATMDMQGDGSLDYEEFLAATVSAAKLESEDNLLQAFADLDSDGSGFISADELTAKLVELGMGSDPAEVKQLIKEADLNNDGQIDYQEFVQMMAPNLLGFKPEDVSKEKRRELQMKGYR